ncbi:hypothetical protein C4J81_10225 [Deltaproteobacteria bacterium Smac51]|nr:hypothetical protein C4J81_10225 [Deltaproteobacteria bacterium Smac51]
MTALDILRKRVDQHGQATVARELQLSKTAVSQFLSGKYQASTARIEERIMNLYGDSDKLICPHQEKEISPMECAQTYERAMSIGLRATGNPETLRQHHACQHCRIRS